MAQNSQQNSPEGLQENLLSGIARNCLADLARNNVRPTLQRRTIVAQIFQGGARHFSAEQLHIELKAQKHRLSLATVYNTLHLLTRHRWLKEIMLERGLTLFDSNVSFHHHLYNIETQEIEDIEAVPIGTLPSLPSNVRVEHVEVIVRVRPSKNAARKNNA